MAELATTKGAPWVGEFRGQQAVKDAGILSSMFGHQPPDDLLLAGRCGYCQRETRFRLGKELWHPEIGYMWREALSCEHCTLNARMRASMQYLLEVINPDRSADIYMTEAVTVLHGYVKQQFPNTQGSEFWPDTPRGASREGVRCEDLCALTFPDRTFDVVISLDVLEHVPDHMSAFRQIARVLRSGGTLLFSIPFFFPPDRTQRRAILNPDGSLTHLTEPQYHGNPLGTPSLCFWDYGWDIFEKLRAAGFADAKMISYRDTSLGYVGGPFPLFVART